jgi:hypothetical protein
MRIFNSLQQSHINTSYISANLAHEGGIISAELGAVKTCRCAVRKKTLNLSAVLATHVENI